MIKRLRCFWTWPFGHRWEKASGYHDIPRLGPLYVCKCGAEHYGSGEQSVGG